MSLVWQLIVNPNTHGYKIDDRYILNKHSVYPSNDQWVRLCHCGTVKPYQYLLANDLPCKSCPSSTQAVKFGGQETICSANSVGPYRRVSTPTGPLRDTH
jgi:hypothetical protein